MSLITVPVIAVPAYLVLGRSKFKGFIFARQSEDAELPCRTQTDFFATLGYISIWHFCCRSIGGDLFRGVAPG